MFMHSRNSDGAVKHEKKDFSTRELYNLRPDRYRSEEDECRRRKELHLHQCKSGETVLIKKHFCYQINLNLCQDPEAKAETTPAVVGSE